MPNISLTEFVHGVEVTLFTLACLLVAGYSVLCIMVQADAKEKWPRNEGPGKR